ncbi:alpha-hydroxy acid oxidase [Massilia sp. DWR3-1-1]|uniref:alpha-hydroxy acid oxidase n=1 Tax=Massilia sp. DWR3-1-1 TaxID=2804559 RepID=UPI003CF96849
MTSASPAQPAITSIPAQIACAEDYAVLAQRFLAAPTFDYIDGGSGAGATASANRAAFARWSVLPRILRDVGHGHTRLTLAGRALAHPILLAPVALQTLAHPGGELESARAAAALETTIVSSTLASYTLEQIAAAAPAPASHWFQLYFQGSREATLALLRRAEAAGCGAIVATFDAAIQAPGRRALRAGFRMPADCVAANLPTPAPAAAPQAGASRIFQGIMRGAPTWDDLAWLLGQTRLPVWVKGVLHPDDARQALALGAAGIVVSNHGGRGLDGAPASLDALVKVRAALGDGAPLLFDGGIRSGLDVFKALALGADAVMVGRLQVYALAVAGALGVAHMLQCLREELELCMALAGCATLAQIDGATVWRSDCNDYQERPC